MRPEYSVLDHGVTEADGSIAVIALAVAGGILLVSSISYWLWRRRDLRRTE